MFNSCVKGAARVQINSDRSTIKFWRLLAGISSLCGAVAACSDEFDSCYSTHTCPREADDGGMGGGDDAAGGASAEGGTSGREGSQSNAGAPGEGGGGPLPNTDELTVVSVSPSDGETNVERDAPITLTLSAPVDATSITAKSFSVTGPDGAVAGELRVEGAAATFTPLSNWSLFADYTVEVGASIAGTDGSQLDQTHRYAFQTRDGSFSKPQRLTAEQAYLKRPVANRAGHVLVGWKTWDSSQHSAVIFDATAQKWGAAKPLASSTPTSELSLAINQSGAATAFIGEWSDATTWQRWNGTGWSSEKSAAQMGTRYSLLADDGTAMAVWERSNGDDIVVSASSLSAADRWGATNVLANKVRSKALAHFGSGYLAIHRGQSDDQAYYQVFDGGVWNEQRPIASAIFPAYYALDTYDSTALFTWIDGASRMHASLFDGTSWTSLELGPGDYGVWAAVGASSQLATWFYEGNGYAGLHDAKSGWMDPVLLGPGLNDSAGDVGPAAEIDTSSNALVAWRSGSAIVWRRAHHSTDWSDIHEIKDQDPSYLFSTIDSSGCVMLVWSNPLGVWASRFE
jgi:hypothetical protein